MKNKLIMALALIFLLIGCDQKVDMPASTLNPESTVVLNEDLSIERIDVGVVNVSHRFPWDANSLVIEMKNSELILIDTPYTYNATKVLIEWLEEELGTDRNITVINTGFHFDNLGGNKYLRERDIDIYGLEQTPDLIKKKGEPSRQLFLDWLKDPKYKRYADVYETLEYVAPNLTFPLVAEQERTFKFGDESLIVYFPCQSHSPDNTVVYYPTKKVLFGGCMVKDQNAKNLGNTADANMDEWPLAIQRLKEKYTSENVNFVVPGHGDIGNIELLDKTLSLFE